VKQHWEQVYTTKSSNSVSWYQQRPALSLYWIERTDVAIDAGIIDVGGGASVLVDNLLRDGYRSLSVLDLSGAALAVAQQRLGDDATQVQWIEGDITTVALPHHGYAVWHDRAVFHFLTEPTDREVYIAQLRHAVKPGGHIIIATFALDGPLKCSGLPVMRYSAALMQSTLGPEFELIKNTQELHETPTGANQSFLYCHFIRR